MANLFFDWIVKEHVDGIIVSQALNNVSRGYISGGKSSSLKAIHPVNLDWYIINVAFVVCAIFTTILFALQFLGTMIQWCFSDDNQMVFQKLLVWVSLWFNDLPQSVLVTIVVYATTDAYLPYLGGTILGVVGQYFVFYALCNTKMFHYPKVIYFHMFLTAFCVLLQFAHTSKAYLVE